jgi:hypothetical protein
LLRKPNFLEKKIASEYHPLSYLRSISELLPSLKTKKTKTKKQITIKIFHSKNKKKKTKNKKQIIPPIKKTRGLLFI